jgi:carboxymethylenebutenolidase
MREGFVELETADGRMDAFYSHPESGGPFPCIILYQDVWGLREELYDIARKVAVVGYCCMVPDLYYRNGKRTLTQYFNDKGQMISSWLLSKEDYAKLINPLVKFTDDMFMSDSKAIVKFAQAGGQNGEIRPGGMGSFGYCLGGRLMVKAAGLFPEHMICGASMHGTYLMQDKYSVRDLLPKMRGEFYFGCGELDPHLPLDSVAEIDRELTRLGVRHEVVIHKGAQHGYALPNRDIFDKAAYNRDWEAMFAMFHRQLPPGYVK